MKGILWAGVMCFVLGRMEKILIMTVFMILDMIGIMVIRLWVRYIGNLVLVISLQKPMNFLMHIMYLQIGLVLLSVLLNMFFWFIGFSKMKQTKR